MLSGESLQTKVGEKLTIIQTIIKGNKSHLTSMWTKMKCKQTM